MYVAPQHRAAVAADVVSRLRDAGRLAPSRAATPSCSWSRRSPATRRRRRTRRTCGRCSTRQHRAGRAGHRHRDALDPADRRWPRPARSAPPRSRPSASGTTPRPAASARPAPSPRCPPPRRRPTRGRRRSPRTGWPTRPSPRSASASARAHDPQLLAPYVAKLPRRPAGRVDLAHARHRRVDRRAVLPAAAGQPRAGRRDAGLAGRARRRPGRPAPAGRPRTATASPARSPRRSGTPPAADRRDHAKDPRASRLAGVLSRPAAGAVSAGRPCGPAGGPSARPSGPRAAAGCRPAPASGSRQLGYSSSVPGWLMVRRSPTASDSDDPDQPGRGPGEEPVQRLDHVALGAAAAAAGPRSRSIDSTASCSAASTSPLLLHRAGQQPELLAQVDVLTGEVAGRRRQVVRGDRGQAQLAVGLRPAAAGPARPSRTTGSRCRGSRARAGSRAPTARPTPRSSPTTSGAGAVGLQREDADQRLVVVAHVGAVRPAVMPSGTHHSRNRPMTWSTRMPPACRRTVRSMSRYGA